LAIERARAEASVREGRARLETHAKELSRFNRVAGGRELRMVELKNEVNELSLREGQPARYALAALQEESGTDGGGTRTPLIERSVVELPRYGLPPLESTLCPEELQRRPASPPDYEPENRALTALVSALATPPATILQTLVETIRDVMRADTAG